MNERLKFSWGHIIAFLAIIIISYISFVGITYWTDENFVLAGALMALIDIVLLAIFIGAQMLKATERKFARRIWFERILFCGSPIVFVIAMLPYFHFWEVHGHDKEIVDNFTNAISASTKMFDDYEAYSKERIDNYQKKLDEVGEKNIKKNNMVETLRLQLLSENYDSLKNVAINWIESSNQGASTFNVFLLGNTKEIKAAIHGWNAKLVEFSSKKLSNEGTKSPIEVPDFSKTDRNLADVDNGLDGLTSMFTNSGYTGVSIFISIITAIILYFALLLPYFIQDRHTKSLYRLFGKENGADGEGGFHLSSTSSDKKRKKKRDLSSTSDDEGNYRSFTLNHEIKKETDE